MRAHDRLTWSPGRRGRVLPGAALFIALLVLAGVRGVDARPSEAQASGFIRELADRAATVLAQSIPLAEREKELRTLLQGGFDIPFIARFTLGRRWNQVSPSEQDAYVELFGDFLLKTYAGRLAAFERDKFEVLGAAPRGEQDMLVQTRLLQPNGPPVKAGWRIRLFGQEPRIVDIVLEGVSMALTQRQEFATVLSRGGIGELMEMLRARAQRLPVEGPPAARAS